METRIITFIGSYKGTNYELRIWPQKPDWTYQYCLLADVGHCMVPVDLGRMFGTYHVEQRQHIEDIADTIFKKHLDKLKSRVTV